MKHQSRLLFALAALLAGCSGGGSSSSVPTVTPTPTPTTTPASGPAIASSTMLLGEGSGVPYSGGTSVFQDGDTSTGGQSSPIDGISCSSGNSNPPYHQHTHISIINGNTQVFMPQAVGLYQPAAETGTAPNTYQDEGTCAYDLHMHDHSGILHVESVAAPSQPYTLGEFFAIWGQPLSTTQVATLTGAVHVYITSTVADSNGIQQPTATPVEYIGSFAAIPIIDHQEITIVVGSSTLPLPRYLWPSNLP